MLRYIIFISIGFIACRGVSTKSKKHTTPPGTVYFKETLFIDKTEIANVHWREFQYWALHIKKDTLLYNSIKLDTTVWRNIAKPFESFYHSNPSYNYYPVVGVSYEQALAFCRFRTEAVNYLFQKEPSSNPFPGKKYLYRLPTKEEWELAAAGKLNKEQYPYGMTNIVGTKGRFKGYPLFNAKRSDTLQGFGYMSPINSFQRNTIGVHNMIGNVSEMIAEKGVAKGGNFELSADQCKIVDQQLYQKAERWLGFRVVCEVVK